MQLWHVGPSFVDDNDRIFGSVIYEEYGSDEIKLNMFSAMILTKQSENDGGEEERTLLYYQEPLAQSWIVDYPLLAYKTFTPRNKEIAIVHLAYNMP